MAGRQPRSLRSWRRSAARRFGPRSPLVRRTDVAEDVAAWVLVTLALLAALGAVVVGRAAHSAALRHVEVGGPLAVRVELLADAPAAPAAGRPAVVQEVPVAWTAPDGTEQTGELVLHAPLKAGSTVGAWVDRDGRLTTTPPRHGSQAAAFGVGAGLTTGALAWALLALTWSGLCRVTAARNTTAWAREWARVEPEWRRRVG
jgi:hypothetical protein